MPLYNPDPIEVLAKSAVKVDRTSVNGAGDATQAALVTVPIAAGRLAANSFLRGKVTWLFPASASVKTLQARLGGVGGTAFRSVAISSATNQSFAMEFVIGLRNALNSQVGHGAAGIDGLGAANGTNVTGTQDASGALDLVLCAAWGGATSGETISVDGYLFELVR